MNDLKFSTLRSANILRLPQFKDRHGRPAHSQPDGSDWKLSAWSNAALGELGELANLIKKIERGDYEQAELQGQLADELADVATYLDILAFRCGVDLGEAVVSKFNRISERVGATIRISAGGGDVLDVQPPAAASRSNIALVDRLAHQRGLDR